jgi:DNA polymerase III epsilon subunit-like protein
VKTEVELHWLRIRYDFGASLRMVTNLLSPLRKVNPLIDRATFSISRKLKKLKETVVLYVRGCEHHLGVHHEVHEVISQRFLH